MTETTVRAGFVITGTEVLAGRVRDRNGPWLADRLAELGVELAHVLITGDRPADLRAALEFMRAEGADIVITSGGLGPTADRSEEHTSELQSPCNFVCRLLL